MRRYAYRKPPIVWSPELTYIIGIIATDGNLSSNGRHLNITSKDKSLIRVARNILGTKNKIGKKARGGSVDKRYYFLQFGNTRLYDFLLSIGLTPAKSKTLGKINIPDIYFADFLRGCIDGDGSIDSFMHSESRLPQYRVRLASASPKFLIWILATTQKLANVTGGWIYKGSMSSVSTLSFGKKDSAKILKFMYYEELLPALARKERAARRFMKGE